MPPRRRGRGRSGGRRGGTGRVARAGRGRTRGHRPRRRAGSTSISAETGLRRSARINRRPLAVEPGAAVVPARSGSPSVVEQSPGDELRSRAVEAEMTRRTQRERTRRDQEAAHEEREQASAPTSGAVDHAPPIGASSSRDPVRPDGRSIDHPPSMDVEMEIMSQPPAESGRNAILYPPLTVRLRSREADPETSVASVGDPSQLWAMVSLMDSHGTQSLAPPEQDLLVGTVAASPRPLARSDPSSDVDESESESFVMFSNLAIREPGQYRLRVTLVQMHSGAPSTSSGPPGGPLGGSSMQEVQTGIIRISDHPRQAGLNTVPAFLEVLRRRGVVVPSPSN